MSNNIPRWLQVTKTSALPDIEVTTRSGNDGENGALKLTVRNWDTLVRIAEQNNDDLLFDSLSSMQQAFREMTQGGDVWDEDTGTMIVQGGQIVPLNQPGGYVPQQAPTPTAPKPETSVAPPEIANAPKQQTTL